jgi:hypothetical protein
MATKTKNLDSTTTDCMATHRPHGESKPIKVAELECNLGAKYLHEKSASNGTKPKSLKDTMMKCCLSCTCLGLSVFPIAFILLAVFVIFVPGGAGCVLKATQITSWADVERLSHSEECCAATIGNLNGFEIASFIGA